MRAFPRFAMTANRSLEGLVVALRTELQEYGGLLRLLHEEQNLILTDPAPLETMAGAIDRQHATAREAVEVRTKWMKAVAGVEATEPKVLARAPVPMRPLLSALFLEVGSVAARAEVFVDQNTWLRGRSTRIAGQRAKRSVSGD